MKTDFFTRKPESVMKSRQDIYLPCGYLKPATITPPTTPAEAIRAVLQYFCPPGKRVPHKFAAYMREDSIFQAYRKGKSNPARNTHGEALDFYTRLDNWTRETEQTLPFFFIDTHNPQLYGAAILFDFEWFWDNKDKRMPPVPVFTSFPAHIPRGFWVIETDDEIQFYRGKKYLYTHTTTAHNG